MITTKELDMSELSESIFGNAATGTDPLTCPATEAEVAAFTAAVEKLAATNSGFHI